MNRRRADRGSTIAAIAGWTIVLAVVCAGILAISMNLYSSSARAEMRLQALAAAEGAAVTLTREANHPAGEISIGACQVDLSPIETGNADLRDWSLRVGVMRNGSGPVLTQRYEARLRRGEAGRWELESLEKEK